MLSGIKSLLKRSKVERPAVERPEPATSSGPSVAPAVFIVCGAGVAFWWWTQWARSREETRIASSKNSTPQPDGITEILGSGTAGDLDESLAIQADAETPTTAAEPPSARAAPTLAA